MASFRISSGLLATLFYFYLLSTSVQAYRVGDALETDIRLGSSTADALRSQTPIFGLDTSARFQFDEDSSKTFSLNFEDGLWGLPAVALQNPQGKLQSWQVTFVYSRSGDGTIHTVLSGQPEYHADRTQDAFQVNYRWVQEEAVRVKDGQNIMYAVVLVGCLIFTLTIFAMSGEEGVASVNNGSSNIHTSSEPKYE
jgi:hypothetical protein